MPTHSADEWLRVRVSQQPLLWKRLNSPATREWIDAIHSASSFPNHKTVSPDNWWHTSLFFFTSQHANMHRICKILSFKGFAKFIIFQSKMLRVNGNTIITHNTDPMTVQWTKFYGNLQQFSCDLLITAAPKSWILFLNIKWTQANRFFFITTEAENNNRQTNWTQI